METYEPIGADEAAAALASVQDSRARVAFAGYPPWYWLATGAGLGAMSYAVMMPSGWSVAALAAIGVVLIAVARAACRARGICEGWVGAMTLRGMLTLYVPVAVTILASAAASKVTAWSPWPAAAGAVVVFLLFAGTGLALTARAARP
jgi:hypothetical protein